MKIITNDIFLDHDTGSHPENKSRLLAFTEEFSSEVTVPGEEYLHLIHTPSHIDLIRRSSNQPRGHIDGDTVVSAGSYAAAVSAVGATIMASQSNDFALVRPPGHHAYADHASGFCLFNNIAIAAEYQRRQGKRVLILDFDGHLGDGTSAIFYHSDEILYWSLHQFPAFPGHGRPDEIGTGDGKGFTINVPLPPGSGDDIFMHAFKNFLPVVEQFEPDVIAISAGFDAHRSDPLLQMNLTSSAFFDIGCLVKPYCDQIFAVLEGGYNTEVLPQCVYNFIAGINQEAVAFHDGHSTSGQRTWETYDINLHLGISLLSPYWKF
jgi:acetoin utilization deacetylase AcuC-like enzyme